MAKRITGIEKMKTSRSKKTKKRLAVKREMLAKKAGKKEAKLTGAKTKEDVEDQKALEEFINEEYDSESL